MRRAVLVSGLLFLLLSTPLRGDALADVRAALDRLSTASPVQARVRIARTETEKEKPKGPEKKGEAVVEHGPSGLTIRLEPEFLPKPGPKAERKKQEQATVRLDPKQALELVDPAQEIRQLLDGAALISDAVAPFEGKSLRTVVFRPQPDVDEEDRKALKKYEDVVTLRLDGDGVPVALDRALDLKFSKLLISFTVSDRESRRFARVDGRLLTATATEESHGSGLSQSGGSTTRWTVTPL
jgi:hypothetical protein